MNKDLTASLAWAGAMIVVALCAAAGRKLGYLEEEAVTRLVMSMNGLLVAWYGNRLPKVVGPSACAGRIARVGGWSMALSGLAYLALWVFAPIPVATVWGCAAVAAGIAVTVGYGLSLRTKGRAA